MNTNLEQTVRVIDTTSGRSPTIPIVEGAGSARVLLWPGNGAKYRTLQLIDLQTGDRTVDLSHATDAVFYVMKGAGTVIDARSKSSSELTEGAMVHIDAGDRYRFESNPGMILLGGPCPADEELYQALQQGEGL